MAMGAWLPGGQDEDGVDLVVLEHFPPVSEGLGDVVALRVAGVLARNITQRNDFEAIGQFTKVGRCMTWAMTPAPTTPTLSRRGIGVISCVRCC